MKPRQVEELEAPASSPVRTRLPQLLPVEAPQRRASLPRFLPDDAGASPDLGDADVQRVVRRIYWARFSGRLEAIGIDPEDGLQDVQLRLLIKSRSEGSRWDPERGSLSKWVFVATRGIVMNLADQHQRMMRRSGALGIEGDVAVVAVAPEDEE